MNSSIPAASTLAPTQRPRTPVPCTHPKALQALALCQPATTGEVCHG